MAETVFKIIYYSVMGLLVVLSIGNFVYTKIKSKKIAKALEANDRERATELQRERNPFEELLKVVEGSLPDIIQIAEQSANNGIAKKFIAMSQIMLECNKVGVNYQEHEAELSKLVDDFVAMSKVVNVKDGSTPVDEPMAYDCEPLSNADIEGIING